MEMDLKQTRLLIFIPPGGEGEEGYFKLQVATKLVTMWKLQEIKI